MSLRDPIYPARVASYDPKMKRFQPTPRSPHAKYEDRIYYFESDVTQRQFAASPKGFARRREN
ncbi:MAG: hypothetical protein E6K75_00550 [Candidatus Eisenbacteria bacterium]|uniref:YHS domain-containing protein n=1 Tax=Eiseniibacteriota bacterium TaxID=2212470 RepID=A0A538TE82_UNCEI|nr:MAG: hypothetical protein E6K75_00550 [Candidatus Eisenbacteria bacterium]